MCTDKEHFCDESMNLTGEPTHYSSSYNLFRTLGGNKVNVLTHTYLHNPPRKVKFTICKHQTDSPLYVWPDVLSRDLQV